jgi:O-antigen/teichoic acid export membrane protein
MRQLYTVAKASFWMFFVKAIGMGAAFFITVIVGRNLGAAVLGDYGLALTIVAVLGIVTKFGTDKNIVRTISGFEPSEDNDRLPQFLVSYYVSAVCLCALITLVLYSGAGILSFLIAASDRNKELFQLASLALLSNTLIATSSGILQARKHYFLSILFQLTTHQLILLAILAFSISKIDSATSLLLCYIVANYVTLIACLLTIKKINSPVGISRQALRSYLSNGF